MSQGKIELSKTYEVKEDWMEIDKGAKIKIKGKFTIRGTQFIITSFNGDNLDIPRYEFISALNKDIIIPNK